MAAIEAGINYVAGKERMAVAPLSNAKRDKSREKRNDNRYEEQAD